MHDHVTEGTADGEERWGRLSQGRHVLLLGGGRTAVSLTVPLHVWRSSGQRDDRCLLGSWRK